MTETKWAVINIIALCHMENESDEEYEKIDDEYSDITASLEIFLNALENTYPGWKLELES